MDDDEDDEMIQNLTKEIEELRAKRLSHDLYKNRQAEAEESDEEFETAIFADTILGELGSSSGSHKDAFELDEAELEADSGASDRPSTSQQTLAPA